jgi:TIR domain
VNRAERILPILRGALDRGMTVEIEGLGVFRKFSGRYTFDAQTRPQVFIAYAVEDLRLARRLCKALERAGCSPWLDKDKLLPGQNWPRAIERAIEISDAFVACFSPRSTVKRGQFQSELRYALDCARRRPLEDSFLIPVRLEYCAVPRRVAEQIQYVDLFPDWQRGVRKLLRAVARTARHKQAPRLCA